MTSNSSSAIFTYQAYVNFLFYRILIFTVLRILTNIFLKVLVTLLRSILSMFFLKKERLKV